jgi:hypothetical protein
LAARRSKAKLLNFVIQRDAKAFATNDFTNWPNKQAVMPWKGKIA